MAMTFGEFSYANRQRCESPHGFNHPLDGWSTSDWMTALVGEVGEAANPKLMECSEPGSNRFNPYSTQS